MRQKPRPVDDPIMYANFASTHDHCQACGIDAKTAYHQRWPGLSRHHIIKSGRSDEVTNLLMLCHRCHELAENKPLRVDGVLMPKLPVAVCLSIKATREPLVFNPARLEVLRGRPLPDFLPIPEVIEREYRQRRPYAVLLFWKGLPHERDLPPRNSTPQNAGA